MSLWLSLFLLLPHASRAPRWCADPAVSAWAMGSFIKDVEADGAGADFMRGVYALPRVPRDSVVLVRDEAICERASKAYYRHELGPTPPGGVIVIRMGNRYAVQGAIRAGEWTITTIFSMEFESIVNVLM